MVKYVPIVSNDIDKKSINPKLSPNKNHDIKIPIIGWNKLKKVTFPGK